MRLVLLLLVLGAVVTAQEAGWFETDSSFTDREISTLEDWVVTNAAGTNYFTKCGGHTVIGGPDVFGKKTSISKSFKLPPHYQLRIQVNLWKMGTWSANRMVILVDGYQWETLWSATTGNSKTCKQGGPANDYDGEKNFETEFKVPHDQPNVSVIFISLQEGEAAKQSWGIRDFKLSIMQCPSECGVCNGPEPGKCFMFKPVAMDWFDMKDKGGWTATGGKIEKSTCAGIPFYGGPSKVGQGSNLQKVFQELPPHYRLKVQFQFWKVDSWDGDQAQLLIDRQTTWTQNFGLGEGIKMCTLSKGPNPDKVVNINYDYPHTFSAARVEFQAQMQQNQQNESFGLRQFVLWVAACADQCLECTGPLPADCTQCMVPFVMREGKCDISGKWVKLYEAFNGKTIDHPTDWTFDGVYGGNANVITDCGGTKLVGGYERFGKGAAAKKVWTNIPKHKRVKVVAEVWKIDAWDGKDLQISIDGNKVWKQTFSWTDPGTVDLCGASGGDKFFEKKQYVEVVVGHTSESLELMFSSTVESEANQASWAFRNLFLWYEPDNNCATLFTECNYGGQSFDLCAEIPNFTEKKLPSKIKSIQVPENTVVTLFDENDFAGSEVEFEKSVECMQKVTFNLAQFKMVKTDPTDKKE